jgi:hypothetical protein
MSRAMDEDSRRTDVPLSAPADAQPAPGVKYWEAQREEYANDVKHAQALIKKFRDKR